MWMEWCHQSLTDFPTSIPHGQHSTPWPLSYVMGYCVYGLLPALPAWLRRNFEYGQPSLYDMGSSFSSSLPNLPVVFPATLLKKTGIGWPPMLSKYWECSCNLDRQKFPSPGAPRQSDQQWISMWLEMICFFTVGARLPKKRRELCEQLLLQRGGSLIR